jgi:hypothetical protein
MTREHDGGKLHPRVYFHDKQNELSQSREVRLSCVRALPSTHTHTQNYFLVEFRIDLVVFCYPWLF